MDDANLAETLHNMMIRSNLIDIENRRIYPAELKIENGIIKSISEIDPLPSGSGYILPGFVDAHIHIESSMMPPSEFARLAVVHGTVGTVSDPHEIANVLGEAGVRFMIDDAAMVPFKFCFGAPSCVPATKFETAGAELDSAAVERLLGMDEIGYLSEVMNFPGVIGGDEELLKKIKYAHKLGKPVDGHAPGFRGDACIQYFKEGITTDHECFTLEEAIEKAELGVKILIREGSAARNYDALHSLFEKYPRSLMFCSDDKHPDDLIEGHINLLVQKSVELGYNLFDVLYAACIHPVHHYGLRIGLLKENDPADFILVDSITDFNIQSTFINGKCVAENSKTLINRCSSDVINNFNCSHKSPEDFKVHTPQKELKVIKAIDGEIVTGRLSIHSSDMNMTEGSYIDKDILMITVVNRYDNSAPPFTSYIHGFGLKQGAIASSVAHDSHNIVAIGTSSPNICRAVNTIIDHQGGISAVNNAGEVKVMPLPIAGLMSTANGYELAHDYAAIDQWTKEELGAIVQSPYMLLSFMALPVIPQLKITDLGLFDVDMFEFV